MRAVKPERCSSTPDTALLWSSAVFERAPFIPAADHLAVEAQALGLQVPVRFGQPRETLCECLTLWERGPASSPCH
jgi:hypothetical protein